MEIAELVRPAPCLIRFHKSFLPVILDYLAAKQTKKAADKAARNSETAAKSLRDQIIGEMQGETIAVCENLTLTVSRSADAAATLTLNDGTTIDWQSVTSVVIGNRHVDRAEIKAIFGGRAGSPQLDVTGAPQPA